MKKMIGLCASMTAILMAVTAFAASNPADNASAYSYNTGKQAYAARMAEEHPWYVGAKEATSAGYSWNTGAQSAQARNNAFAALPTGDELSEEELDSFFRAQRLGDGSAYADGQYDEAGKSDYGYMAGQAAYQSWHAVFETGK